VQFGILRGIEMGTAMLVYIPVAYLADRSTKRPYVAMTFVFFSAFPLFLLIANSFALLALAFVVRGLKEFGEPTRKALIMDLAPEGKKGSMFGVYYLARDLIVSLAAFGGAFLWTISPQTNFLVAFAFGILGTLYFLLSSSSSKKQGVNEKEKTMLWVTRSHVHVDRVACPWLITRFVDSEAEFLFVPKNQIDKIVEEKDAIPFDAPGVELGHKDGKCSFETIMDKYGLEEPGLLRLAKIVHAADIEKDLNTDPYAPGLEAIAQGFSLMFPEDQANLEAQFVVYDALYAWCRLDSAKAR